MEFEEEISRPKSKDEIDTYVQNKIRKDRTHNEKIGEIGTAKITGIDVSEYDSNGEPLIIQVDYEILSEQEICTSKWSIKFCRDAENYQPSLEDFCNNFNVNPENIASTLYSKTSAVYVDSGWVLNLTQSNALGEIQEGMVNRKHGFFDNSTFIPFPTTTILCIIGISFIIGFFSFMASIVILCISMILILILITAGTKSYPNGTYVFERGDENE